ncbi:hypothetical protein TNCV_2394311 [Trichonephila clavipes]|nr:hypothetical protein TNCV_2394311 [Trichonephila clavipes]
MCQIEALEIHHGKGLDYKPVVSRSLEHYAGNSTFWFGFIPVLRENTLGAFRGLPPLFPFHQPHEKTCGLKDI